MHCPSCNKSMHVNQQVCDNCGFDLHKAKWVIIKKVFPPDDAIIESLLRSFDIPVKLVQESIGALYGLSVGSLGEVKILVPESTAEEALTLLQAEMEDL